MDIFRGAGGLSSAVRDLSGPLAQVLSSDGQELARVDVGNDEDFAKLLEADAEWAHSAPPCRTFSAARRNDMHASVTEVANKLAYRTLELAKVQVPGHAPLELRGRDLNHQHPTQAQALLEVMGPKLLRGVEIPGPKANRERQNAEAVGGLRNPNRAVARSRGLQEVGKRTRAVLEGLGQVPAHWHDISNVVERLGTPEAHGFPKPLVELLRQQLRKEFNVSDNGDTTSTFD